MIVNRTPPLIQCATRAQAGREGVMPRRMIARMFRRLDASTLPYAERLDLEAELPVLLRPTVAMRAPPFVLVIHEDARGENDTSIPN